MPILAAGSQAASWGIMVLYVVLIIGFMYFLAIKPQKKQEKKQKEVMDAVAVGDSILTTSGFYGMVIWWKQELPYSNAEISYCRCRKS